MKFRNIIMLSAALLLALGFTGCSKKDPNQPPEGTPEAAAYAFAQALYSGDSKSVISQLELDKQIPSSKDGNDKEKAEIKGKLEASLSRVGKDGENAGGIKDITVSKAEISEDGKTAKTNVTVTFNKSKARPQHESLTLIKLDDKWVVRL